MKKPKALINGIIYSGYEIIEGKALLINNERIEGIVELSAIPENYELHDVFGANICPGLIDLQIYGAGKDLFSAELTSDSIRRIEQQLLEEGCTSFYLTLATNTLSLFKEAIAIFNSYKQRNVMGLHLEGPFLNTNKRGAHPEELIIPISKDRLEGLLENAGDCVKIMTVAPELLDDASLEYLLEKGVLVSAGHSSATFAEAYDKFDKGIPTATHLWNAMSPLHHRDLGLPGAIFNHPDACASIIVDGIHVSYEMVKLSKKIMGERLFLITDAVAECEKGVYQHILNGDHFVLPDGTLSGSALSLLQAIRNCVEHANIELAEAIRMATLYPARLMKLNDLGTLNTDCIANILVFDNEYKVQSVFLAGEQVL